jgi:hypothetical protein
MKSTYKESYPRKSSKDLIDMVHSSTRLTKRRRDKLTSKLMVKRESSMPKTHLVHLKPQVMTTRITTPKRDWNTTGMSRLLLRCSKIKRTCPESTLGLLSLEQLTRLILTSYSLMLMLLSGLLLK